MSKRSNGEGSSGWITIKGKKYWRITLTTGYDPLTGKQLRKMFYAKTQKECKEKLKIFNETQVLANDKSTLGNFFYNWLYNIRKQELKPSSFERLEGIYRLYIKANKKLCEMKITDIDTIYLQEVTNKLLRKHTVNQVKNLNRALGSCFKYAIAINKINYNPVPYIVYPKNYDVLESKENYITEEEQKKLVTILNNSKLEGIILAGLMCGLRLGEAMAITEDDINFDTRTIRINKSVKYVWTGEYTKDNKKVYEYRVSIPKTKSSVRSVPFPSSLVPVLKSIITKNKENKLKLGELYFDNKIVFCKDNGEYIDSKQPNRQLKAALKKAGINKDINYHSLRHIFITNCISKDINIKTVMNFVGHADMKTTMTIYAEVNKDKDMKEYEKINEMFL